jgi:hypothetical protein
MENIPDVSAVPSGRNDFMTIFQTLPCLANFRLCLRHERNKGDRFIAGSPWRFFVVLRVLRFETKTMNAMSVKHSWHSLVRQLKSSYRPFGKALVPA